MMLYVLIQEGDQVYWSRLYRARADIDAIETAAELFRKRHGSYPVDLEELVRPPLDGGDDRPLLPRMVPNPWGGPFHYEVKRGANGESIKIWVVPDAKTQHKLGTTELSNNTDWRAILK